MSWQAAQSTCAGACPEEQRTCCKVEQRAVASAQTKLATLKKAEARAKDAYKEQVGNEKAVAAQLDEAEAAESKAAAERARKAQEGGGDGDGSTTVVVVVAVVLAVVVGLVVVGAVAVVKQRARAVPDASTMGFENPVYGQAPGGAATPRLPLAHSTSA